MTNTHPGRERGPGNVNGWLALIVCSRHAIEELRKVISFYASGARDASRNLVIYPARYKLRGPYIFVCLRQVREITRGAKAWEFAWSAHDGELLRRTVYYNEGPTLQKQLGVKKTTAAAEGNGHLYRRTLSR